MEQVVNLPCQREIEALAQLRCGGHLAVAREPSAMRTSTTLQVARQTKSLFRSSSLTWSVIGFGVLIASCSNETWHNLDRRNDRDVSAIADDFDVYPDARISYRANYHPDIWNEFIRDDASKDLEEFEQDRSRREAGLLKRKLGRLGLPEDMIVVGEPVPDDGRNILLSMNFGPAGGDELYSVTFTARQGSLYHEEISNPTELHANIDFMEPIDAGEHRRINTALSMDVDSAAMVTRFLRALPEPRDSVK